jgi:hypothetical protein
MTDWALSLVAIVPAAQQDAANRLACALGYDVLPGNTFSVPLSSTGAAPATHYGCRSLAKQEFLDVLGAAAQGQLPPIDWSEYGITETDISAVLASLFIDRRPADQSEGHAETVLAAQGLAVVAADETA